MKIKHGKYFCIAGSSYAGKTSSNSNPEVNQRWAKTVLGWETACAGPGAPGIGSDLRFEASGHC